MKLRNAALAVMAAFAAQAPSAAYAERDPTGRWDTREAYRAQREERLRKFEEAKKAPEEALAGAPKRDGVGRSGNPNQAQAPTRKASQSEVISWRNILLG